MSTNNGFEKEQKLMTSFPDKSKKIIPNSSMLASQHLRGFAITLIPLLGFVTAIALLNTYQIGYVEIGLLLGMWILTGSGITVGFHRHFAHRAFQTNTAIKVILTIFGCMAGQGPLIYWVTVHRRHHEYSDQPGDPHSPHLQKDGNFAWLYGLWHAHVNWIFNHEIPNPIYYAPELLRDKIILKVNQLYLVWLFLGLAIPTIMGGIIRGSLIGALYGFLWGGLVRLFLCENMTLSINSITHFYGSRPFHTNDHSTNNIWLAIPTLGESWHNNHHAFINSAIFGLEWWQFDFGARVIRGLEKLGLVWDVKIPTKQMIESKKAAYDKVA
ncbi:acyl-CoA desaturase [Nostoc sp. C117]|uniref:acyl-CoA desaturase n=1 Tax=Nostoc sp. C117 TaxID=3349875 RepID=UPI00370DC6DA